MLPNFLQKPLGVVAVLATAVGGPYAAFETELGNSIRRSLISTASYQRNSNGSSGELLPNATDPYSLTAANHAYSNSANGTSQPSGQFANATYPNQPSPYSQPSNSASQTTGQAPFGNSNSWNDGYANTQPNVWNSSGAAPQGQIVSTVYGPTTITPIDPRFAPNVNGSYAIPPQNLPNGYYSSSPGYGPNIAMPQPTLETRSGPSNVVPGNTDRLWDYTLGTPTLPQIQQQPNTNLGGGAVIDLREVLRFDIVPGWLPQRFSRVTTVTSNVQMDGLRVPLITGTQPKDIAGTLTYFFDASKALKRINMHGLTGDPTELANLMVQYYQLKPEQSLGGQLFTARWNNRVTSVMQISPAPIIYAGADHSKYIIFLELNQPSNQYGLSDEASEVLRTSQATQRW
jgi:hypothetical protein